MSDHPPDMQCADPNCRRCWGESLTDPESTDPECPSCAGTTASPDGHWKCGKCFRIIPPITTGNPPADREWLARAVREVCNSIDACATVNGAVLTTRQIEHIAQHAVSAALPAISGGIAAAIEAEPVKPTYITARVDTRMEDASIARIFGSEVAR